MRKLGVVLGGVCFDYFVDARPIKQGYKRKPVDLIRLTGFLCIRGWNLIILRARMIL